MMNMDTVAWAAHLLSSIGAMNWGLVAFFNCNCVEYLLKLVRLNALAKVVYGLIALSGLYVFLQLFMG